jgi:protein-disulfide isomerase
VTDARSYAQMQHVKYTPSFMVNGKLVLSNELIDTVEAALAEAGK